MDHGRFRIRLRSFSYSFVVVFALVVFVFVCGHFRIHLRCFRIGLFALVTICLQPAHQLLALAAIMVFHGKQYPGG